MSEARFSYSPEQLQEMSESVLALAKAAGASAAEADISLGFGQNVSVRDRHAFGIGGRAGGKDDFRKR